MGYLKPKFDLEMIAVERWKFKIIMIIIKHLQMKQISILNNP